MAEPVRDTAPAGFVTHVIPVSFDDTTHSLIVARELAFIKPGDTVVWTFGGAPSGFAPWIQFRPNQVDGSPFGPLDSLHQTHSAVWGVCRPDHPKGSFTYRAVLQKGHLRTWEDDGSSLWSRNNDLAVTSPTSGVERVFTVTPDTSTSTPKLAVSPEFLELKDGDTMVWSFENIPPGASGWLPRVTFFRYDGEELMSNLQLGPFTSLITDATQVRGTGNNDKKGLYFFEVALVSATTGEVSWVSSGDPVVDNRDGVDIPG